MKKLIALLVALLLTLPAVAETPDLTDCTMEELLLLRQQVDAAMVDLARNVDRSEATLDGLIWASNGTEVRINAYEGTATEVVIPAEINGLPVTRLQTGAFRDCRHVTSITLPDTITEIPETAFFGCSGLITVNIPSSINSIGERAFYNCSSLTNVNIPAAVTHIGARAFCGCKSLRTVILPEGLKSMGYGAFERAEGLTGVMVLPSTLTSLEYYTFDYCNSLRGVVIQSDLTLDQYDFRCSSLDFVYIREGAAVSLTRTDTFHSNLRVVIIPASVTSIAPGVFENCNRVTIVAPAGSYAEQYCRDNWIVCNTKDYDKYVAEYEALLAQ